MKKSLYVLLIILCPLFIFSQNVEIEGGLIADSININGGSITNLANPISDLDAATKQYVDDQIEFILSLLVGSDSLQQYLNYGFTPLTILNLGYTTDELIGLEYQGGYIFYLESNGTGLVALANDLGSAVQWGCYGSVIPGADSYTIGGGSQNTIDIEAACGSVGTAADLCANFIFGDYTDWFLPSDAELYEMYIKIGPGASPPLQNLGTFNNSEYWSSTEFGNTGAVSRAFSNGSQVYAGRNNLNSVRPIRAF